jgi:hypothetical protein
MHERRAAGLPRSSELCCSEYHCSRSSTDGGLSVHQIGVVDDAKGVERRVEIEDPLGVAGTLSSCILWRRFDRGVAEEEGLARFQRRH